MNLQTALIAFVLTPFPVVQEAVVPRRETQPVHSPGDAADDAAIWVHPTDRSLSVVIATNKAGGGLEVFDLAGNRIQTVHGGRPNNVDLRRDVPLGGELVTVVATGNRSGDRLEIYVLDPVTRLLRDAAARDIRMGIGVYGCCLYRSPFTGLLYFFGTSKSGNVEQWVLFDDGSGRVDARRVRAFDVGEASEGCVADDGTGFFFIGEESLGVWRYDAEPGSSDARVLVDSTAGNLRADVEGLSMYYAANGGGYLLVSSQGDDTFSIYDRQPPHAHRLRFEIVENPAAGIDAVGNCDGLDVTNLGLSATFRDGLVVVQDGTNPGANQNFKLVRWGDIAARANPPLLVDSTFDPQASICQTPAAATSRAGSNAHLLDSRSPPALRTTWRLELDCSGHAQGFAEVVAFARPGSGIFTRAGELLIDPTSARLWRIRSAHSGGTIALDLGIPDHLALCGLAASVQGLCWGRPGPELSNAIDVRLGF